MKQHRKSFITLLALCVMLLTGCAAKVELSGQTVKDDIESISARVTPEDLEKLDGFENLTAADFSGSTCYEELAAWAEAHPQVDVLYTVPFPGGIMATNRTEELDLTGMKDASADQALENLAYLPRLKSVDLGTEQDGLSPKTALRFLDARPDLAFSYHCRLLGKDITLDEKKLDLSDVSPNRIKAALDTISCLRELKSIELGSEERENHPTWSLIRSLRKAAPEAEIHYSFTLYGVPLTLEDEEVDISYNYIADQWPEVLEIAECVAHDFKLRGGFHRIHGMGVGDEIV